jgi:hypothetical protein
MKMLLVKHQEFNMETHIAFVDLKKAFDKVNRTKLLEIPQNDNIPQQIIQNMYNLYKTSWIVVEDKKSEWKAINSGVRQGCGLLPILFIIYMNVILKEWRQKPHGYIPIDRKMIERMNSFIYLDCKLLFQGEVDLPQKITKYTKSMGLINEVLKPTLVQKYIQICLYKTLALPVLCHGSEAWTIRKGDSSRLTACEMKFTRRTAGYMKWDHKK